MTAILPKDAVARDVAALGSAAGAADATAAAAGPGVAADTSWRAQSQNVNPPATRKTASPIPRITP
ncbi:MAG TPA: hypothetical protein P5318_13735 [Candidatus Hydrogenedentes bacterium]|nr:hypothetical protein [Candidatus Hydrogenedentota bacterium]HRT21182.1 hypothetical protein [Candidatus Hydrogenedentota bacterium]HRT65963.1 hypothetical protein [Candidatus Hydrogenedentota bacterium]